MFGESIGTVRQLKVTESRTIEIASQFRRIFGNLLNPRIIIVASFGARTRSCARSNASLIVDERTRR